MYVRSKRILIEEDLITRTDFVDPLRISSRQVSTVNTHTYVHIRANVHTIAERTRSNACT